VIPIEATANAAISGAEAIVATARRAGALILGLAICMTALRQNGPVGLEPPGPNYGPRGPRFSWVQWGAGLGPATRRARAPGDLQNMTTERDRADRAMARMWGMQGLTTSRRRAAIVRLCRSPGRDARAS
jgi:hypothetical protein